MRLVSLCPSLTELVFALGRGGDLVGVTRFCVRPAGAVEAIEKVGGTKNPRVERIVALAPDLVLLNEEENRLEDARRLEAAGVRCHASLPRDPAETAATVRQLGGLLGRAAEGERLAAAIETSAREVARAAADRAPVRFAYLIWRDPWMAAGGDTYAHSLFAVAGGVNVFAAAADRYPEVGLDELAAEAPERLFLASEPYPFAEPHRDELAAATGLPRRAIRRVDGERLNWHGPRTPEGLAYAAGLLEESRAERLE